MDIHKVFHMTPGNGKTSYANNSSLQKRVSDKAKHIIIEAVEEVYRAITPKSIGIADLGCSSGPNTLSIITDIFLAVQGIAGSHNLSEHTTEFRVYLNDLPTNDFNSVFKALPEFLRSLRQRINNEIPSIFVGAYPASFYGRLFPDSCLHFVHSSHSLHWLSRVPAGLYDEEGRPLNKGCIYISELSPPGVAQAYYEQFQQDFSLFLASRSEEVVVGGRMALVFLGRRGPPHVDTGISFFWQILSCSFATLVSKGEVEEEKLDSYDVHFYAASREEIEDEVKNEGSFEVERLEMCETDRKEEEEEEEGKESYGRKVAKAVRAIQESMISQHFGEAILDALFDNYATLLDQEIVKQDVRPLTFVVVLKKL